MKRGLIASCVCVFLVPMAQAAGTPLPDACGDSNAKFDVKTVKDQPVLAPHEAGKALIVFIETMKHDKVIIRFGVDGNWVGANKGNSYFVFAVSPGERHLCAAPQSTTGSVAKQVGTGSFTAEAGMVYYYQARVSSTIESGNGNILLPAGMAGTPATPGVTPVINPDVESILIEYGFLKEDEGARRVKASVLSTSVQKK